MRLAVFILSFALLQIGGGSQIQAQVPNLNLDAAEQNETLSPEELQELVGPIALYPDDLLSLVLPAATYPVQIVQASRYLKKSKKRVSTKPEKRWDPSVVGLLNYPEVLDMMNADLDWTWKLGTAVANQLEDVLKAIQDFRQEAKEAGNLESNEKQEIIEEDQVIVIKHADPDTIYVPDYDPEIVVSRHSYPVIYEYSDPYPIYYYPIAYYPTYWASFFVSYGFDWYHHRIHRYYRHRKHIGKRPYSTNRWTARHRRIGRPDRRFVRPTSVRNEMKRRSGDQFQRDRRGDRRKSLRTNASPDRLRTDKPSRIKERDVQRRGPQEATRRVSRNEGPRVRKNKKQLNDISGNRRNLKRANAPDRPRSKKLARVKERNVQARGQQKARMRASRDDVPRARKNRTRVKKNRSRSKLRTATNRKRQKVRRRVSSKRKVRNQTRRTRVARINRKRSVNRTRVRSRSARRNVQINRGRNSGGRGRVSVSRSRAPKNRGSRGGNRGSQRRR